MTQSAQADSQNLFRTRVQIVRSACTANGDLERLLVRRFIYRRLTLGLFRLTGAARQLDASIAEAVRRKAPLSYASWLETYQPLTAQLAGDLAATPPASVFLNPGNAWLPHMVRCLRALRRQHQPIRSVFLIATTRRARLKARIAILLAGGQSGFVTIVQHPGASLGEEVLWLKGAPLLRTSAVSLLTAALRSRPGAEAVYADEDRIGWTGLGQPFFKPDFSPVLGTQYDFVGSVALFRSDFFLHNVLPEIMATGLPGWIGNAAISRHSIIHLPDVLHSEPVSRKLSYVSGKAFDRDLAAAARRMARLPAVSIIIPTKDRAGLLRDCVDSIFQKTDYDRARMSVVIVDNGSTEVDARSLLGDLARNPAVTVLHRPGGFNYAWLCNQGAAAASAELLVFINNDIVIRDADWLAKLAGAVALPGVGVVGCKLLYPTGLVQHAGVIVGLQGMAGHIGVGAGADDGIYFDLARHTRELTAVTGALVGIRADLFRQVGGYDENLAVAFNDTALCLSCNALGRQTLFVQSALAFHLESASRGHDDHALDKRARLLEECHYVLSRYAGIGRDPFYSVNLGLVEPYQVAHPPRHIARAPLPARGPRVLMLSSTFEFGHGVAVVVDMLARGLEELGCTVFIGAPRAARPMPWPPGRLFEVADPMSAAGLAAAFDIDVVMSHTPPFYSVFHLLPAQVAGIAYDHGEPPPALFPDAALRRVVDADKFAAMRYADRLLAISEPVRQANPNPACGLLRLGNTHLTQWGENSAARRVAARTTRGWAGQLVLLNVCRFHEAERCYKGVDFFVNLRRTLDLLHPEIGALTRCVLAGKATRADADSLATLGLDVIANPSDELLADTYHACDLYVSFSRWEGYNLGIGQALALGLPVIASDIPAHRAFEVTVVGGLAEAVAAVVRAFNDPDRAEHPRQRLPRLQHWEPSQRLLRQEIDALLARTGTLGQAFERPTVLSDAANNGTTGLALRVTGQNYSSPEATSGLLASLHLGLSRETVVSILIDVEGQPEITLACLRSIAAQPPACQIEIILANDASAPTPALDRLGALAEAAGARVLKVGRNDAAAAAHGRYLYFLDNGAAPRPGAIDALVELLDRRPDAGLAGSKLVDPSGILLHAGGIVWADGSASDIGRGQDVDLPEFNYVREADYCAAASIMVRRELWKDLGGYDATLGSAMGEVIDFAFRMRAIGQKALYEPRSVVVLAPGREARGVYDASMLRGRWAETLSQENYPPGEHPMRARDRARSRPVMLAIDHRAPEPDRDAGSRSVLNILLCMQEAGWVVKFWPNNQAYNAVYTARMEALGIEVIDQRKAEEFSTWIAREGGGLDQVLVVRPEEVPQVIGPLLRHTDAVLSFYGLDLHFARMRRRANLAGDAGLEREADTMELLERRVWRSFDVVVYPSDEEAQVVRSMAPNTNVHGIVPFCFDTLPPRCSPPKPGPRDALTLLFVAGYAHNPNVDAAQFLVHEVLPLVERAVGPVHLILAGSNPTAEVQALAGPRIEVTGFIDDDELARLYRTARAAVVPLRFGAGVKGKVIEALSHGLPVVTTSTGAQGIEGLRGIVPVHDDPASIATALVRLLRDDEAWLQQSWAQSEFASAHYSAAAMRRSVRGVLDITANHTHGKSGRPVAAAAD